MKLTEPHAYNPYHDPDCPCRTQAATAKMTGEGQCPTPVSQGTTDMAVMFRQPPVQSDKEIGAEWDWWWINAPCHARTCVLQLCCKLIEERAIRVKDRHYPTLDMEQALHNAADELFIAWPQHQEFVKGQGSTK